MGMALGSLFVKKYFDENSKNDVSDSNYYKSFFYVVSIDISNDKTVTRSLQINSERK